ncbi:hypothetical protein BIV60_10290 [Bacillus sp. MUM 116]|uniref:hypothetical protein n=1 Tax=Bacillus sp. MUM 116 TaxID=1678002 RepID=UPI0008F55964|nr:hypothetical protein [Bacillus sp. MUM 116]OIK15113.1 hypothetical protein BIV60_10290 [Bacillus sp. MUM 116]
MNTVSDRVKAYFKDFERANNMYDPDLLNPLVSDPLVGAYPSGVVQAVKKEDYLAGTKESGEYLKSLGYRSFKLTPVAETPLKDNYVLVKVLGTARIEKESDQSFDLVHDSFYILHMKDDSIKMVFTITHDEPTKMMEDQGFLTTEP